MSKFVQHKRRLISSFGLFAVYILPGSSTDEFSKQVQTEQGNRLTQIFPADKVAFPREVLKKSESVDDAIAVIVGDQEASRSTDGMLIKIKISHCV